MKKLLVLIFLILLVKAYSQPLLTEDLLLEDTSITNNLVFMPCTLFDSTQNSEHTVYLLRDIEYSVQVISVNESTNWPGRYSLYDQYGRENIIEKSINLNDKNYVQYHVVAANKVEADTLLNDLKNSYSDAFIVYWNYNNKRYN